MIEKEIRAVMQTDRETKTIWRQKRVTKLRAVYTWLLIGKSYRWQYEHAERERGERQRDRETERQREKEREGEIF